MDFYLIKYLILQEKVHLDIYDYNFEKKRVNPIEIISNYTFQKTKNEKGEDIIEVINKN